MDGDEDPTNLLQLAKRCQRIKQELKKMDQSQLMQDQIAKQSATRKNNGNNGSNRQCIVNSLIISAALQTSNSNATSMRISQISQLHAQLAAPLHKYHYHKLSCISTHYQRNELVDEVW